MKRILGLYIFDSRGNTVNVIFRKWYTDCFTVLWWIVLLPFFVVDYIGVFSVLDKIGARITGKRNLTDTEIEEAASVFEDQDWYAKINIKEDAILAKWGARLNKKPKLAFVLFNSIYFSRPINAQHPKDMGWLIHEMVHVSQYNSVGIAYIFKALRAQLNGGYQYDKTDLKLPLKAFNFEQQGDIARHYYQSKKSGEDVDEYTSVISDLVNQRFC